MIKVENVEVFNFGGAIRGMRNPMNSWSKSDSKECPFLDDDAHTCKYCEYSSRCENCFVLGEKDLDLMQRLYAAGPEHAKFLRQIFVSMDIIAPAFWVSELDTYKIGVTRNSCSFQHKGTSSPFCLEYFAIERLDEHNVEAWDTIITELNRLRDLYLKTNDYTYFRQIRSMLPSGWLIRATYSMSYANVMNMINQRENHKLDEWREFVEKLKELPYVKDIRGEA